jgi:coiled-coil domain-containing protein 12
LSNRNFDPQTRTLRKRQADVEMEDTLEHNVQGLAEQIIAEDEAKRAQDLVTKQLSLEVTLINLLVQDLLNIAPKRPNWDLKREMEKKLARLERQTQQAIHTLIRMPDFTTSSFSPIYGYYARATACRTKGPVRRSCRRHASRSKC